MTFRYTTDTTQVPPNSLPSINTLAPCILPDWLRRFRRAATNYYVVVCFHICCCFLLKIVYVLIDDPLAGLIQKPRLLDLIFLPNHVSDFTGSLTGIVNSIIGFGARSMDSPSSLYMTSTVWESDGIRDRKIRFHRQRKSGSVAES